MVHLGDQGCPEASCGAILALSGGILASLGAHLGALEPTWALLNSLLVSSEAFQLPLGCLGLLWAAPAFILAPFLEPLGAFGGHL